MKIFNGNHTEERPEFIISMAFDFLHYIFAVKDQVMKRRKLNPKKEYSIFDKVEISSINVTIPNIQKKFLQTNNLVTQNNAFIKKNHLEVVPEQSAKKSEELKKSLRKSNNFVEYKNDFTVELEEEKRLRMEDKKAQQAHFDEKTAEQYIKSHKVPKESVAQLRNNQLPVN